MFNKIYNYFSGGQNHTDVMDQKYRQFLQQSLQNAPKDQKPNVYRTDSGSLKKEASKAHKYVGQRYMSGKERDVHRFGSVVLRSNERIFAAKHGFTFERYLGGEDGSSVWLVQFNRLVREKDNSYRTVYLACKVMSFWLRSGQVLGKTADDVLKTSKHLKELRHENIVQFDYLFHIHNKVSGFPYSRCFLFMELCEGDLKTWIDSLQERCLVEEGTKEWFVQIAEAVHYLHGLNVSHLDISLRSILYKPIEKDYIYKLGDFHTARRFPANTLAKINELPDMRPPLKFKEYWPPELKKRREYETKPVDIYCLGCALAASLVGSDLYLYLMKKLREGHINEINQKSGISQEVLNLITALTAVKPQERPTISQLLGKN